MAVAADPTTHKKLVLVKQLYQRALVESENRHSVVSRMMAVVGLDLAAEIAIKAMVGALDPSKTPQDNFQALVQSADSSMKKSGVADGLPDKANIQHVHTVRNDAQHKARYPNETEVNDCRTYTRDFLGKITVQVWGLRFERISLADIVAHEKMKDLFNEAEQQLQMGQYGRAVIPAFGALAEALNRVESALVGQMVQMSGGLLPGSDWDTVERMRRTLLSVALGLDYGQLIRFGRMADHVIQNDWQIGADDAEALVAYCIDAVAQIEGRVGDIDAPFQTVSTRTARPLDPSSSS